MLTNTLHPKVLEYKVDFMYIYLLIIFKILILLLLQRYSFCFGEFYREIPSYDY